MNAHLRVMVLACFCACGVLAADGGGATIKFQFRQVDLRDLVQFMAKIDGKVMIAGDDIKGKVSVSAPGEITLDEAYQIVAAVLETRKFNLIRTDTFLKVVPMAEAPRQALPVYYGDDGSQIPESDAMVTAVIPIRKASANSVLETLRPLISATGSGLANKNGNLLIVSDAANNIRRFLTIIPYLDQAEPKSAADVAAAQAPVMVTEVYVVNYLKAKELCDTLQKVFSGGMSDGGQRIPMKFIAVDPVNSIIVTAPPDVQAAICETMAKLDVRRRQVLVEFRVVEYGKGKDLDVGVKFDYKDKDNTAHTVTFDGTAGLSNFFQYGVSRLINANVNIDAVLALMEQNNLVTIVARPRVFTADNQKATLRIGEEEPIVKSETNLGTDGSNGNTVTDYVYKDVGLELEVTPHINATREVDLEISFKMTSILAEKVVGTTKAPEMGKREMNTNITIRDGNTLVLGGHTQRRKSKNRSAIPVLGNLPWIGFLFGKTVEEEKTLEMALFITPRVIETPDEAMAVTGGPSFPVNPAVAESEKKEKKP